MSETMRALVIERTGAPGELHLAEVPRPTRVSDEVLVRVVTAGVNPIDVKTRAGRGVAAAIGSFPAVLGNDFAGVVERCRTRRIRCPRRPRLRNGARAPARRQLRGVHLGLLDERRADAGLVGFAQAAAVPLAALTAWGAVIDTARAHDGQRVLIHAGAGGVGHFAVQLAAYFGAEVTATCSAANLEFVQGLGARRVIDYGAGRFEEVAGEQDVVIDLVGNGVDDTGSRSLDVLRPHGLIVSVPTGSWPTMAEEAAARGIRATGYSVSPDARTLGVIRG